MDYNGFEELGLIDKYLKNYNQRIVDLITQKIEIDKVDYVLDFGAGIGTIADIFYKKTRTRPDCFEICNLSKKILFEKRYKIYEKFTNEEKYDLIYSSNVLEHIENDFEIVLNLKNMLKKNGYLIIIVPAISFLFSELDFEVGHFRRYDKKKLEEICLKNDLKIKNISFFDSVGFFILVVMKFLKINTHKSINRKNLTIYDKIFVRLNKFMDLFLKKICGKNIVLIAIKL